MSAEISEEIEVYTHPPSDGLEAYVLQLVDDMGDLDDHPPGPGSSEQKMSRLRLDVHCFTEYGIGTFAELCRKRPVCFAIDIEEYEKVCFPSVLEWVNTQDSEFELKIGPDESGVHEDGRDRFSDYGPLDTYATMLWQTTGLIKEQTTGRWARYKARTDEYTDWSYVIKREDGEGDQNGLAAS